MNKDELEDLKKQHLSNYKKAIKEIITNNTFGLFDDDIMSLFRIPPLDSMDLIKSKFISVAKREKLVINTGNLNEIVSCYRNKICKEISQYKSMRIDYLCTKIDDFIPIKDYDVFKLMKKDLNVIDKKIKSQLKVIVNSFLDNEIINKMEIVFNDKIDNSVIEKIKKDCSKYLKKDYIKQLFENIDVKIIVKNTTLINGVKEQGERYIFTNEHSRLFNVN